jgi:hypothetical protein
VSRLLKNVVSNAVNVILINHELLSVDVKWLGILYYAMEGKYFFKLLPFKLREPYMGIHPSLIEI